MTNGSPHISTGKLVGGILGAIATAGAIWAWGFMVGDNAGDSTIQFLQEKNASLEKENDRLESEKTTLQVEIAKAKPGDTAGLISEDKADSEPGFPDNNQTAGEEEANKVQRVRVTKGNSVEVFDGQLLISVIGTSYEGTPLRYIVTAVLGAKGRENLQLNGIDPGFRTKFGDFEVTLLSSDSSDATFSVERLDKAQAPPNPAAPADHKAPLSGR